MTIILTSNGLSNQSIIEKYAELFNKGFKMVADFLQIPPQGGHLCLKLTGGTISHRIGLSPTSKCLCRAY